MQSSQQLRQPTHSFSKIDTSYLMIPKQTRVARREERQATSTSPIGNSKSYCPIWEQCRPGRSDESSSEEDEEEDDYTWYYSHPERYVYHPRKTRRIGADNQKGSRSMFAALRQYTSINEEASSDEDDTDSCSSSSLSDNLSYDSDLSNIECSTPSTSLGSFCAVDDQKRWSFASSDRGSFQGREWIRRWRFSLRLSL